MTGSRAVSAEAEALDAELIRLHGVGRPARLSELHRRAAAMMADAAARRFHLTHAWVFALEAGDAAEVETLESELRALGGLR